MTLFTQYTLYGLSAGAVYALLACGLVVAYRASGYLNFTHPYVGMLATLVFVLLTPTTGVVAAALVALALGASISAGLYHGLFSRLAQGPLGPKVVVSLAAGIGLQVIGGILFINFGDDLLGRASPRSLVPQTQIDALPGTLALTYQQAAIPVAAVAILVASRWLFNRTDFGLALRACAQNPLSAALAGLPRRLIEGLAWALCGALAALAGVLAFSSQAFLVPTYLFEESIRGFVAALAGGFVNFRRAVAAAVFIGLAENLMVGYGGALADLRGAVTFAIVTVVALIGLTSARDIALERAE